MKCLYPQTKITKQGAVYGHRCGQCLNCRVTVSQEWALRLQLETPYYPGAATFVTLTYTDSNLPRTPEGVPTVRKADVSAFMKRLRVNTGLALRYYGCTEYGDRSGRPHAHLTLYGMPFYNPRPCPWVPSADDQAALDANGINWRGYGPYEMEILRAWQCRGSISVSELNPNRADYSAKHRYVTKHRHHDQNLAPGQEAPSAVMSKQGEYGALGSRAVPALAAALKRHSLATKEMARPDLQEIDLSVIYINKMSVPGIVNPLGGQARSRRRKATYPIARYLREKIIEHLGGDQRTELEIAQEMHRQAFDPDTTFGWSADHDRHIKTSRLAVQKAEKDGTL